MAVVVSTPDFERAAKRVKLAQRERDRLIALLAMAPHAGDLVNGAGGARKLRLARPGMGKSGGYRVITYFGGGAMPVYLMDIYQKSDKANLESAEIRDLRDVCKRILASHKEVRQ